MKNDMKAAVSPMEMDGGSFPIEGTAPWQQSLRLR